MFEQHIYWLLGLFKCKDLESDSETSIKQLSISIDEQAQNDIANEKQSSVDKSKMRNLITQSRKEFSKCDESTKSTPSASKLETDNKFQDRTFPIKEVIRKEAFYTESNNSTKTVSNEKFSISLEGATFSEKDFQILSSSTDWLTDNIIDFFMQLLSSYIYSEYSGSFEVLSPSFCQFLKVSSSLEDCKKELNALKIDHKKLILMFVSDAVKGSEGTHWSLLLYIPRMNHFHSIDTIKNYNKMHAESLARKIVRCLSLDQQEFCHCDDVIQKNNSDCGIHVIENAKVAIEYFCKQDGSLEGFCEVHNKASANLQGMRQHLLDIVKLILEKQKEVEIVDRSIDISTEIEKSSEDNESVGAPK